MASQQYNSYGGGYGQGNPYANNGGYENPPPTYGQASYGQNYGQNVEMQPLATNGAPYPTGSGMTPEVRDPNAILNDCRNVGRAVDDLKSRLGELERLQKNFLSGSGASNKDVDALSADIMTGYRGLADRVKRIKSQPDAQNPRNKSQVDALDRRIRDAIQRYQERESSFRRDVQEQQRRQYLIVRPDATESEIREATEAGGDTQIFQQALMNADRRGQAQSTLRNVRERHDAIQQIERTMIELQQLFQDLDAIVVQQEAPVMAIEQKAEETHTHLEAGNVHVGKAVDSARAARKKKWICLGICGKFSNALCKSENGRMTLICSRHYHHHRPHHRHLRRHPRLVQVRQQRWQQQRRPIERMKPTHYIIQPRYPHRASFTRYEGGLLSLGVVIAPKFGLQKACFICTAAT